MSSRSPRALRFGSRSSSACNPLVLGNRAHGGLRDRDSMGLVRARDFELASILPRALLDPATALFYQLLGSSGFLASTQAEYQKLAASCAAPARSCSVTGCARSHIPS